MIFAGTPAYDAGLDAGGQIAALDSFRLTRDTFDRRLQELRPGDSITRALFRDDELRASNVKLGDQTEGAYRIPPHTNRPPAAPVLR